MGNTRKGRLRMKHNQLLIVFAKNSVLGTVKTRLAKTKGNAFAFDVYRRLVSITEQATMNLQGTDVHVYFSDTIDPNSWSNVRKYVQQGADLGARMRNAFQRGFDQGYERIIGIGTDLPDLSTEVLSEGLIALESHDTVFGPSEDGGYYLIGMRQMLPMIFEEKPWSTEDVLSLTLEQLKANNRTVVTLRTLNDIDILEDLEASWLGREFDL